MAQTTMERVDDTREARSATLRSATIMSTATDGVGNDLVHSAEPADICAHCGEPCVNSAVDKQGHIFCCWGCQTVFGLLTESGLGRFYELSTTPGTRVGERGTAKSWVFLDTPEVRRSLLDYADAQRAKVRFHLPSIHCLACVWLLENLFRLQPGILDSRVNFLLREAQISFDPVRVELSELAALLASLGYEPALTLDSVGAGREGRAQKAPTADRRRWLQLGIAGFGFGNIMLLALPNYLGLDSAHGPWFKELAGWLGLVLAAPVLLYSASDYWRAAWQSLRQRLLTLDVPIALGLAAIYGQSVFEVATGRSEGYSDSLTGLIFFLLCGRLFQRKTFDRLAFDRDYKGFFPLAALRKTPTGEAPVALEQIQVGDPLVIRHGELIPADARLLSGNAWVDYSFVTGESQPVACEVGGHLYAGGRQMGTALEIETVKPVSESYLTSLWNHEAFQKPRQSLMTLTNRYSQRFTVLIVGIAVAAALGWSWVEPSVAMKAFVSVLIVACPCALALAAPLTLGTAQRRLATQQVYLRNAETIERLSQIDTIVFDKTGTLTAPRTAKVSWSGTPLTAEENALLHSSLRQSAHPLAVSVAEATRGSTPLPVQSFTELSGCGTITIVDGHEIRVGSARWLGASAENEAKPGDGSGVGAGSVHVAIDGRYRGCFVTESVLRPEIDELLRGLRDSFALVLLSGDKDREAKQFAALFGEGARVEFNQSPFDKLDVIRELQAKGHKVMMIGDGLNDAGALQQADAGVAVVEQAGIFSPASDVILAAGRLTRLKDVLTFAQRSTRIVRAGFLVSGLYNVVGITIAAAGALSPLVCAVLMPLSSATVVLFAVATTSWTARRIFRGRVQAEGSELA